MKICRRPLVALACLLMLSVSVFGDTVRGLITDPAGIPVPGARLALVELGSHGGSLFDEAPVKAMTAGADGTFSASLSSGDHGFGFPLGGAVARARIQAPGYSPCDVMLNDGDNKITLGLPTTIRGRVLDTRGEPVSGVKVRWLGMLDAGLKSALKPDAFFQGESKYLTALLSEGLLPVTAVSGTDGQFEIPGGLAGSQVFLGLDDPRFVREINTSVSDGPAVTLTAIPGAGVKGRLCGLDGHPAPGIPVAAFSRDQALAARTTTDANGWFELDGLGSGQASLAADAGASPWLFKPLILTKLRTGVVKSLPDWIAEAGTPVSGHLIDKATGQALAGLKVATNAAGGSSTVSDAHGAFQLRFPVENHNELEIYPGQGYPFTFQSIQNSGAAAVDLGPVPLEKGVVLTGTVSLEDGTPAPGARFFVAGGNSPRYASDTDDDFTVGPIPAGHVNLVADDELGWTVVSPTSIETAPAGQPQTPIDVIVKKLPVSKFIGRVVTPTGAPVAGITLRFQTQKSSDPPRTFRRNAEAETGADGAFSLELVSGFVPSFDKVTDRGYLLATAGQASLQNGVWTFSDTVVRPLDGTVTGRVLDVAGNAVAGALVTGMDQTAGGDDPVVSDATGHFRLTNLPEGQVTVMAATATAFANTVAATGADTDLTLAESRPLTAGELAALQDEAVKSAGAGLNRFWNELGEAKLREYALRADGVLNADGTIDYTRTGTNTRQFLQAWAEHDAAHGGNEILDLVDKSPALSADQALPYLLWRPLVQGGDETTRGRVKARILANIKGKVLFRANDDASRASAWFFYAGLLAELGDSHADECAQLGDIAAESAGQDQIKRNVAGWGESLGCGGLSLLHEAADEWPAPDRFSAFLNAADFVAKTHPEQIDQLFQQLHAMHDDPEVKKFDANGGELDPRWQEDPATSLDLAESRVAVILAATDPAKVLDQWTNQGFAQLVCQACAENAIAQNKPELAVRAFNDALKLNYAENLAYLSALARPIDAGVSQSLSDAAKEHGLNPDHGVAEDSIANFAFYDAALHPAADRLLLEGEWNWRTAAKDQVNASRLGDIAVAMSVIDPHRALEMLRDVPDDNGPRSWSLAQIYVCLSTDEATRRTLNLFSG